MTIKNTNIGWYISDIVFGQYVQKNYYGYTKREAIKLFKKEFYMLVNKYYKKEL